MKKSGQRRETDTLTSVCRIFNQAFGATEDELKDKGVRLSKRRLKELGIKTSKKRKAQ